MKRVLSTLTILILVFGLTGCTNKSTNARVEGKINVVTSFYTMQDFAYKVGGDKINVINLVPSGTEPHDWEPKAKDITKLKNADVFVYNGAGMENWVTKVLASANNKDLVVVEATKGISLSEGHDDSEKNEDKENIDPHVWLNPKNAIKQLESIKNSFVSVDAENKDFYEANYKKYSDEISRLDKDFKDAVATFKRKDIVVAHAAFGYLCEAYGLNQVAIEGLNAESEPTAARMAEISKFAKENNVKTIFFEELVSPKVAKAIAKEVGAQTDMLNPLEGLTDEAIAKGKEYISVMRDNLEALKKALS